MRGNRHHKRHRGKPYYVNKQKINTAAPPTFTAGPGTPILVEGNDAERLARLRQLQAEQEAFYARKQLDKEPFPFK